MAEGRRRPRAADPLRHHPAHHPRAPNGTGCERGPAPAREGAEPLHPRRLPRRRRSCRPASSPPSRSLDNAQYRPEMMGVDVAAATSTRTSPASTSCAPGQDEFYVLEDNLRMPVRRVVHAGKPQDDDAALPGAVRAAPRRAGRRTIPTCCSRRCARSRRPSERRSDGRRAHARHLQQRLLRALLPGPADGRGAGRGRRTSSSRTTSSTCAPPQGRSGST